MTFRESFELFRQGFFDQTTAFFKHMASYYGFPENPGMPIIMEDETFYWVKYLTPSHLPIRKVRFPPPTLASNFLEIVLGNFPKASPILRYPYQTKEDGYFCFFIENFSNSYCFPDIVSEFIQIKLGFCQDISYLEFCRETVFGILVIYYHLLSLRLLLAWFISVNPYTFPLAYYIALIDWFEETAAQYVPALNGLPVATPFFMFLIGKLADVVNNLIITIPFLPSEGVGMKTMLKGVARPVKLFRYLPILWYKYPIPNEIREYWFKERTDILQYLLKAYKETNIQFLPDPVVLELQHLSQSIVNITSISIPSEMDLSHFLQI